MTSDLLRSLAQLKAELQAKCPLVARIVYDILAPQSFAGFSKHSQPKHVNDPVWRLVELAPLEVSALDLPLMQRLRRVRQLGMAHVLYPSAQHSRFEHSIGALAAATQMFDSLVRRSALGKEEELDRFRRCIRLAALMHDCGHGAFSHVSERVLASANFLGPQFKIAKTILDDMFKRSSKPIEPDPGPEAPPPAAELLSALLLLTPEMTEFLKTQSCGLDTTDQLRIVAMVLGRSYQLQLSVGAKQVGLEFAKGLISGDIDADKLDYVARDAYFAGIPIAADVHRLINQLDIIAVQGGDSHGSGSKDKMVLAVQSTGIATVEMFIFTRAYLFDRIYQHPKVRAAESVLERQLLHLTRTGLDLERSVLEFIKLTYHSGGDDYCIGQFSDKHEKPFALNLANRVLPRRVLAVAPRFAIGYAERRRDWSGMLRRAWTKTITEAPTNIDDLEELIAKIAGVNADQVSVIIDMPRKSALKGNPELYVRRGTTMSNEEPEDIGRHFDAAQFSAAYENVKKTIWIFSDCGRPASIAAAAALIFMVKFGLVPSDDGLIAAKIDPTDFANALKDIGTRDIAILPAVSELERARGPTLSLPTEMLASSLKIGDRTESLDAAAILSTKLNASGLTKESLDDLDGALAAVRWLIDHDQKTAHAEGRNKLSLDEAEFRSSVETYLRTHAPDEIDPERESDNSAGRADFALRLFEGRLQVALELKAENRAFDAIVRDRISQPFHYASDTRFGRIAILYVRFRDDRARRPLEDFDVHTIAGRSPLVVICIGQRTTSGTASTIQTKTAGAKARARRSPRKKNAKMGKKETGKKAVRSASKAR